MPKTTGRRTLRQQMRALRRQVSPANQRRASTQMARHLRRQHWLNTRAKLALYWPNDGEIDPRAAAHTSYYLPVLHRWQKRQLRFTQMTPRTRLKPNRFGIPEPIAHRRAHLRARQLDVVLVPLVAFDRYGGRLGMGGGFYDTTFAFKRRAQGFCRPRLIGVAHSFQEVDRLALAAWDVPLDGVVTEREFIDCRRYCQQPG